MSAPHKPTTNISPEQAAQIAASLKYAGFDPGDTPNPNDARFQNALNAFKQAHALQPDGAIDERTVDALNSTNSARYAANVQEYRHALGHSPAMANARMAVQQQLAAPPAEMMQHASVPHAASASAVSGAAAAVSGGGRHFQDYSQSEFPPGYVDVLHTANQTGYSNLMCGLVAQESGGNPHCGSMGSGYGLGQIKLATARVTAQKHNIEFRDADLRNPEVNLQLSRLYLQDQIDRFGSTTAALAAYNAGPERVADAIERHGPPDSRLPVDMAWLQRAGRDIPESTKDYVCLVVSKAYQVVRNQSPVQVAQAQDVHGTPTSPGPAGSALSPSAPHRDRAG